jgi:drug/metabolite transporter (DMT)-like permease
MIKLAGESQLPNYEIVAFLGIFIALFVAAYAFIRGEAQALRPKRPAALMVRATLDVGNNIFVVVALRHLSLTLFYILVFMSPMVVAILGRIFLKESLNWRKAAAIIVGFAGVVIAVDPLHSVNKGSLIGYGACAICVCCFSTAIVWSRVISRTERPESVVFVSGLVTAGVGLLSMLAYAAPLNPRLIAVLVAMGLLCALGNICIFIALKHAAAATVSQYHYTQLVVGAAVAYLMFNEKLTSAMLAGAVLIIAAGLYIALRGAQTDVANAAAIPLQD